MLPVGLNTLVFLQTIHHNSVLLSAAAMLSWLPVHLSTARQHVFRALVTFLARIVKKPQVTRITIDKSVAYHIPRTPLSSSWLLVWKGYLPVALRFNPNWYVMGDDSPPDGIRVNVDESGSTRFTRIVDGKEVCLHRDHNDHNEYNDNNGIHGDVPVLEARLYGKPGSVFKEEFPDGVDVGGVLRIPTFARLTEIVPCVLSVLSDMKHTVAFEDPNQLYLCILIDDTFDEVTFHANDLLVI
jgi:hypothetical protein